MPQSSLDLANTDSITENVFSLQSVVKQSYTHAKKHLHDGVSFVKDELLDIYDIAGNCITKMVLPVNNFLKDLGQIDQEFQYELSREIKPNVVAITSVNIIPLEQALTGYMEENY